MKKTLSLFLAALMLLLSLSVPSFAFTQEEWDAYLAAEPDADDGIIMQPGADGTQKNFSWYVPAQTQRVRVLVAASPDLAGARAYDGKTVDTYQGDKAAKVTVTDLQPGTTYYYACETDGVKSAVYSFSTPAADRFSALYVTDIHVSETEDPAELSRTALKFNEVLTQAQTMDLFQRLLPESVTVEYEDPMYGAVVKQMYANNHPAEYLLIQKDGTEYWSGITFPLIEM